jgi:hypothetical protein
VATLTEGPTLTVREREITYSEEWGGDLSPTGQPGFSTLLSFLNRTSISTSVAVALTKIKHRKPVLRIRMFLGLLDPDPVR